MGAQDVHLDFHTAPELFFFFFLIFVCTSAKNNAELHPVFGEKVACAAVSLHLCMLSCIQVQCYPTLHAAALSLRGYTD